jgi:hypothetical protein
MSMKDIPLFKTHRARPPVNDMIKALEHARKVISYGFAATHAGICCALPVGKAGGYLAEYITKSLDGYLWLNSWRAKRCLPVNAESMRAARLAWIDWMLELLKEEQA